jgi:hypothetical protein
MFYGKESIQKEFELVTEKLNSLDQPLFMFESMPSYKNGERWTDEFRIRDGHTKLADGTWVTVHNLAEYVNAIHKNTTDLYEQYQKTLRELSLTKQKNREMEYGLRVAEKALKNSLALTKEMINE